MTDFFNTPLYATNLIYIDFWTFLHFFLAIILMLLINYYTKKNSRKIIIFSIIIIGWELFEYLINSIVKLPFIPPETTLDVIWDFIIGTVGGAIGFFIARKNKQKKKKHL